MAQPTRSLRISVLQVESHCPAADENSKDFLSRQLERIKKLAGIAHAAGAEMAVFPELFLCGYESGRDKLHQLAQLPRESPCLNGVAQIACDLSMYLVVPYAERDDEGSLYNAAICYSPSGAEVFNYRKTHLFGDYEMNIFKAGDKDQLKVTTLEEHPSRLKIGCLICMDIEYCEPARVLALQGMELLIVPTGGYLLFRDSGNGWSRESCLDLLRPISLIELCVMASQRLAEALWRSSHRVA